MAGSDWQTGASRWSLCFSGNISVFAGVLVEILCDAHVIEDSIQLFRVSSSLLAFFLFIHLLYSVSLSGHKQQRPAQHLVHAVPSPDGGSGVHPRQQYGHVPGSVSAL